MIMKCLVAIDDTDNLESAGTGELASTLSMSVSARGWGRGGHVTRHQMLVHPDIPYTSHNSAMCFPAEMDSRALKAFVDYAMDFLQKESASGSDPGLCVVTIDRLAEPADLIAFGKDAKCKVLQKSQAYELARRLEVHLSEHGGTGQGVIGALAAVGLRMTGNDGRFKGHVKMETDDDIATPADIKHQSHVQVVQTVDGRELDDFERVRLGRKLKAVLLGGKSTLLVCPAGRNGDDTVKWETCSKQFLRAY
jgi:hypothetical protein